MEERILNNLQLLRYKGDLPNKTELQDAINSEKLTSFIELVAWLATKLKDFCQLNETITGDSEAFDIEIKGFVRELGFPYGEILQKSGLHTSKGRLFVLDFLITELQACHLIICGKAEESPSTNAMELEENTIRKSIEKITTILEIPLAVVNLQILFKEIEKKLKQITSKLPEDYLKEPLLKKTLSPSQWEKVEKINDAICLEYKTRRKVLIKRVDVTLQSFSWSEKLKTSHDDMAEINQLLRSKLIADSRTTIVDILTARSDLCVIAKTSSGDEREVTKCDINKVMIGKVPDRGGRPSLVAPPPEMPKFRQRTEDSHRGGGRGGGRGRSSFNRGRGSVGGGYSNDRGGKGEYRNYGKKPNSYGKPDNQKMYYS